MKRPVADSKSLHRWMHRSIGAEKLAYGGLNGSILSEITRNTLQLFYNAVKRLVISTAMETGRETICYRCGERAREK